MDMTAIKKNSRLPRGNNMGFTLIEMAVVLIIIGLIIGAVVKGKDLVTSAKQKKLYTQFLQSWQLAFNSYYDRTGWILGDQNSVDNNTGVNPRDGHCSDATEANLVSQLTRVGLTVPPAGATGSTTQRLYRDAQGNDYTLTIRFRYDSDVGNYIEITDSSAGNGMPVELGIAWDNIIDGQADGTSGSFRFDGDGTIGAAQAAWPRADQIDAASVGILILQF